ncbi:MAG TPA: circadian clock protein KaiC [Terriglobales bacterium]|nr:circadian clock protein KaiC [Terriglobales bacterium]
MEVAEQIRPDVEVLQKCVTGISGLDEITSGGLPRGRPTLVCGSAGTGKSLLAMEFLVRGARDFGEPGVYVAFEETAPELAVNVASLGFEVPRLERERKLLIDSVQINRAELQEAGEYDLEGLFIRLGDAIDTVGAKRVVLDTIEVLFGVFQNSVIVRSELSRLFRWLKDRGVTAIVTGERGDGTLSRFGLEEYVADCVILLDHRIVEQVSTRRLRVVKYRGSVHGTNEYPFLIGSSGFSVLPVTSLGLQHRVSSERISTGIPELDEMCAGKGIYRGSSVLISGMAGTGKTSFAAQFAAAACLRGERVLYVASEESPEQILRNMASIGLNLRGWQEKGLLRLKSERPTLCGLELHLVSLHEAVRVFRPHVVVYDPITNFSSVGSGAEVKTMLMRLVDYLKAQGITAIFTSLTNGGATEEQSEVGISSLMDVWILLRNMECSGERNRALYVLKARGIAHSNQVREFTLSTNGIHFIAPYLGMAAVLTGSARLAQEAEDRATRARMSSEVESRKTALQARERELEAQIEALQARLAAEKQDALREIRVLESRQDQMSRTDAAMSRSRSVEEERVHS